MTDTHFPAENLMIHSASLLITAS